MQCLLLRLKSQNAREASLYPAVVANCLTISHTFFLVFGVAERNEDARGIFRALTNIKMKRFAQIVNR